MDSTIIRAYACSTGNQKKSSDQEALGRSKGGDLSAKFLVEALSDLLKFISTLRQRTHSTQANRFIAKMANTPVIKAKRYDDKSCLLLLQTKNQ